MARPAYGWEHQQARAAALAALAPGDSCPFCGGEIDRRMALDFDHYPPLAVPIPATLVRVRRLAHRSCNRRAGQRISATRRRVTRARGANSQTW